MTYIDDIFEQPAALRRFADASEEAPIRTVAPLGGYDRIIITGMGGSHFANYSLWRDLVSAGARAEWIPTDELLSLGRLHESHRHLVIAASQSGLSGEVVAWVQRHAGEENVDLIAVTNNPEAGVLTTAAGTVVQILAGPEATVGTKTYLNTLAAHKLLGDALLGRRSTETLEGIRATATGIEEYLAGPWRERFTGLVAADRGASAKLIIGRGAAVGSALQGALIVKEAAKLQYEGISAGQFRHGPLDLTDDRLLGWFLADADYMEEENQALIDDIVAYGGSVFVTGARGPVRGAAEIPAPRVPAGFEAFSRIVPIELANIPLAESAGHVPGEFRHNEKVTTQL